MSRRPTVLVSIQNPQRRPRSTTNTARDSPKSPTTHSQVGDLIDDDEDKGTFDLDRFSFAFLALLLTLVD